MHPGRLPSIGFLIFGLFSYPHPAALADATTATVRQVVVPTLKINRISDLDFGTAEQGSGIRTILPGQSENPDNASFEVRGEPNRSYTIQLPTEREIIMTTQGGGRPQNEIRILRFQSFPAIIGSLNPKGESMLYVGATRDAIRPDQTPGEYTATFIVNVVY